MVTTRNLDRAFILVAEAASGDVLYKKVFLKVS